MERIAKTEFPKVTENSTVNPILSFARAAWDRNGFSNPHRADDRHRGCDIMEIILHLGAHRTATTSLQHYLRGNARVLARDGIEIWEPRKTRDGLFGGVIPEPGLRDAAGQLRRARGRIALHLHRAEAAGMAVLLVSDENMLGAPRRNLRDGALYAGAGLRMARFAEAFGGRVSRAVLSLRALDSYWASVLAYSVMRGHRIPLAAQLAALAAGPRSWRDVITDLACALPGVDIIVLPHEQSASRPAQRLAVMTGRAEAAMPRAHAREWLNRAPMLGDLRRAVAERGGDPARLGEGQDDARWQPFSPAQGAALSETYADDLFWLRAGADGLATLIEETGPAKAGRHPPAGQTTRGHRNGIEERRLA
jgi:hypothetical protein